MKYLFYLIFSKIGIIFSDTGRLQLQSALSAFTKAKNEINMAIDCELKTIGKIEENLENAKKKFEQTQKYLDEQNKDHLKIWNDSRKYLEKIEDFLKIDIDSK
jgi:K+/H+ antiporter YhaU regulatory subunit KhtT